MYFLFNLSNVRQELPRAESWYERDIPTLLATSELFIYKQDEIKKNRIILPVCLRNIFQPQNVFCILIFSGSCSMYLREFFMSSHTNLLWL